MSFYFSLLLLFIVLIYVLLVRFNINYLYLAFMISIMTMINLDGIRINNKLFSSMDILMTAFLMIIFLITILKRNTKILPYFLFYGIYLLNALLNFFCVKHFLWF